MPFLVNIIIALQYLIANNIQVLKKASHPLLKVKDKLPMIMEQAILKNRVVVKKLLLRAQGKYLNLIVINKFHRKLEEAWEILKTMVIQLY